MYMQYRRHVYPIRNALHHWTLLCVCTAFGSLVVITAIGLATCKTARSRKCKVCQNNYNYMMLLPFTMVYSSSVTSGVDISSLLKTVLHLCHLFEAFALSTHSFLNTEQGSHHDH